MGAPRLSLLLVVALLAAASSAAPRASIEATIRGTDQPLRLELLIRAGEDGWKTIAHRALDAGTRRVRFEALEPGVYQLLVRGSQATEQLATKIVLGSKDHRAVTIAIEPVELTGRVTYGGTAIGGVLLLHHKELHWRGGIPVGDDGTFRAPLWQRGEYAFEVRAPALATPFRDVADLTATSELVLDIPDGRIRGIVREAGSGAPVAQAAVLIERESVLRVVTDGDGRFDLTGMKDGGYRVRVISPAHLDPEPVVVQIDGANRQRELEIALDRGRTIPVVVLDARQAPVGDAAVFVVAGTKLCSRTFTNGEGRTNAAAPADEDATLFVVPRSGSFGVQRVARNDRAQLRVHLPPASSSLLIRALTTTGAQMPPFSLLMRYNGTIVPPEVAEELAAVQGLMLAKGEGSDVRLQNIPSGSYEFWPYRTSEEAEAILASADGFAAPIQINVRTGENSVAVKFAAR